MECCVASRLLKSTAFCTMTVRPTAQSGTSSANCPNPEFPKVATFVCDDGMATVLGELATLRDLKLLVVIFFLLMNLWR